MNAIQRMMDEMTRRGYAPKTIKEYSGSMRVWRAQCVTRCFLMTSSSVPSILLISYLPWSLTMTPLRQRMLEDLCRYHYAPGTQQTHVDISGALF